MNDLNSGNEFDNDKPSEQSSLDTTNSDGTNSDEISDKTSDNRGLDDTIPDAPLNYFEKVRSARSARITASNNEVETEKKPAKSANKLIRNKSIKTRVNEAEKEKISDDAKAMHLNVSDYIRSVALRKRLATPKLSIQDVENLDKALREVKSELNRMGNNINQIAKYANVSKDLNDAHYMQFFGMLGSFKRIEDTLAEIKKELQ